MIGLKELAAQRGLSIQITASADEHAKQVVDRVLAALRAAIDARGRASLALSGGRSPKAMLRRLTGSRSLSPWWMNAGLHPSTPTVMLGYSGDTCPRS